MTFTNIKTKVDLNNTRVFRKKLAGLLMLLFFVSGINLFVYSAKYASSSEENSIVNTPDTESNESAFIESITDWADSRF